MKILEVRDGFIKLETRKTITTGSFLEAKGMNKSYIAQVVRSVPTGEYNIVIAKMLFTFDGIFTPYDNTVPSINAEIRVYPFEEIVKTFETPTSINFAKPYGENISIKLDKNVFNKKFLASIENPDTICNVASTIKSEFSKELKSLIIDTIGVCDGKKYIAGVDFKLPLNTDALAFLYEECLNDATSDSKSLIKEIFQDLSEYSKTVPFLPFSTLKTIIDDMVEKQHIFKLLVLKNKLAKFDNLGYFASDADEVARLKEILKSKTATIDLSKLDPAFQNRYLEAIYLAFEKMEEKPQIALIASNNLTKKTLKLVLTTNHAATALIVNSRFKYLKDIKPMFNTYLIEPNFVNNDVFKTYSTTLSALPKDACLLIGSATSNIAINVSIDSISEPVEEDLTEEILEAEDVPAVTVINDAEEKDEQTLAIEKKSDDLIEKISEEVETAESSVIDNLFSNEDEAEDELEDDDDDDLMYKEEPVQYSTQVHSEVILEEEPSEDVIEEVSEEIAEAELSENIEDPAIIEQEEQEEIIEVEMPDEIIELDEDETLTEESVEELVNSETIDDSQGIDMAEEIIEVETEIIDETLLETNAPSVSEFDIEQEELVEEVLPEIIDEDVPVQEYETLDEFPVSEEVIEDSLPVAETVETPSVYETLEVSDDELEEVVELDEEDLDDADDIIMVDVEDEPLQEIDDELDKEIVEDVDKVFTTMKEDTLSESDLDFIDELNDETSDEDALQEYSPEGSLEELSEDFSDGLEEADDGFLEPIEEFGAEKEKDNGEILETRNTSTPMVPVYDADIPQEDTVMSDPLEQGDSVVHAKYGNGVVEKMINYGTKTLYSINFENVGRRLLDPTITEIKKA